MNIVPERFNSTSTHRSNTSLAPRPLLHARYRFWGSECTDCGNATHGTMVCDECGTDDSTKPLWIER